MDFHPTSTARLTGRELHEPHKARCAQCGFLNDDRRDTPFGTGQNDGLQAQVEPSWDVVYEQNTLPQNDPVRSWFALVPGGAFVAESILFLSGTSPSLFSLNLIGTGTEFTVNIRMKQSAPFSTSPISAASFVIVYSTVGHLDIRWRGGMLTVTDVVNAGGGAGDIINRVQDVTQFHTYRLALGGGRAKLLIDGNQVQDVAYTMQQNVTQVQFGNVANRPSEWDFIRMLENEANVSVLDALRNDGCPYCATHNQFGLGREGFRTRRRALLTDRAPGDDAVQ